MWRARTLVWVVLLGLAVGAPCSAADSPETAAGAAASSWLALVDAGQYGESWDAAAELFKKTVTREQWLSALTQVRTPLGSLVSRKLRGAKHVTDLPGAPSGDYVVLQYDVRFANLEEGTETITPMKDPDGSWRVSGYFVRPGK